MLLRKVRLRVEETVSRSLRVSVTGVRLDPLSYSEPSPPSHPLILRWMNFLSPIPSSDLCWVSLPSTLRGLAPDLEIGYGGYGPGYPVFGQQTQFQASAEPA